MKVGSPRRRGSDPIVLIEAALILLFLILFLFLYVLHSKERLGDVPWWAPVILGAVALAALLLDNWRRRRRYRREIEDLMEAQSGGAR